MNIVIGLAGVKTSGKSTVANIIKNLVQDNIKEAALADKLKNTCSEVFNVPRAYFDDQNLKERPLLKDRLLDLTAIEKILISFNIEPTNELVYSYITKGIDGTLLETPRQIAQIVGTEILRVVDEEIHCKNVELNKNGITIISDIRFPNEYDFFSKQENNIFLPLYIQRDEAEKMVDENSHSSEKLVFTFSHKCIKINNNNDLSSLERQVVEILREKGLNLNL